MAVEVIVALIGLAGSVLVAAGSIVGVVVSNRRTAAAIDAKMETNQAVMQTELKELTREVRAHNNFAQRVPVLEAQVKDIYHHLGKGG